jgi:hypothetical protein
MEKQQRSGSTRRISRAAAATLAAAALAAAAPTRAVPPPVPVTQFDMTGYLQSATLDATDVLSGGTLMVNNQLVTVPRNAIVVMPAAFITWQQLFALAPPPYGPSQTGIAMADVPAPFVPYEVHVIGNRVAQGGSDEYIAGLIFVAQHSLQSGQGYINFIDYSTGELRVGGFMGDPTTGQRVRLNDPLGKFGRVSTVDPRFTTDEDNPNIRSETGYPVCIPRVDPASGQDDPLCPQKNRPFDALTGTFVQILTMPPVPNCTDPVAGLDPCVAAPLEVGDFVTYSGELVKDGPQPTVGPYPPPGTSYVSAWQVTANVGLFTMPGTDPVYVATDVSILGTGGVTVAGAAEATIRTRFEGFTTDPSRLPATDPVCSTLKTPGACTVVDLYGIDIDPCTGTTADRPWGAIDVDPGPPSGAVAGRWRFRPPSKTIPLAGASGTFDPPPQQMRAKVRGANVVLTRNNLLAGQYAAPIAEYLFPENAGTGQPIVPNNFESFPFLVRGLGPVAGAGSGTAIVGQLSPWPGAIAPAPVNCSPVTLSPPVASAGASQTVASGATVALDGSASSDPNGLAMTYAWTQTSGPAVALNSASAAQPSFIAPIIPSGSAPADLVFSLTVTDTAGLASAPATVTITVSPAAPVVLAPIANAGNALTVAAGANVLLNGTASSDPNNPPLALTYAWTQTAGTPVAIVNPTLASASFKAPAAATAQSLTFTLTVTSSAGLQSSASVVISVNAAVAPIANPGPNQNASSGAAVTLNGLASVDPNGLPLTFQWTQVSGPAVTLVSPTTGTPGFTAPTVAIGSSATIGIQLIVRDQFNASVPALVTVTVFGGTDAITITAAEYRTGKQRLTVSATSSLATAQLYLLDPTQPAPASCAVTPLPSACIPMTIQAGIPTAVLVGVAQPASVTVVSNLGGKATSPLLKVRN